MHFTVYFFAAACVFDLILCNSHTSQNKTVVETVEEITESEKNVTMDVGKNLTEGVEWISKDDMGMKGRDAMNETIDDEINGETSTAFMGIDENGCNRGLLKRLEDDCDTDYEKVNEDAQLIEDEDKKTESVCCALEDFEKCSLRVYDKANCATDKAAIRENLKAAQLFLSVVGNISCTKFRGQCAFYTSDSTSVYTMSYASIVSTVFSSLLLLA